MLTENNDLIKLATKAAIDGGAIALKYFRNPDLIVKNKGLQKFDPVTEADLETEKVIRNIIKRNRPLDMIFGEEKVTTGASSDIRMVSDTARRMVTEWGLSEKLGFLAYSADEQEVFLGRSVSQQKNLSDSTAKIIDDEIRKIVDDAYLDATKILKKKKKDLDLIANALLEYETLNSDDISNVIKGKKLDKDEKSDNKLKTISRKKPRTSVPSNSGRIKPGHQPT